jgi:hypothetical protein
LARNPLSRVCSASFTPTPSGPLLGASSQFRYTLSVVLLYSSRRMHRVTLTWLTSPRQRPHDPVCCARGGTLTEDGRVPPQFACDEESVGADEDTGELRERWNCRGCTCEDDSGDRPLSDGCGPHEGRGRGREIGRERGRKWEGQRVPQGGQ